MPMLSLRYRPKQLYFIDCIDNINDNIVIGKVIQVLFFLEKFQKGFDNIIHRLSKLQFVQIK